MHAQAPADVYSRGGANPAAVACASCHGAQGEGMEAGGFPRLAGLPADYIKKQLADFASGARANPIMQPIASALTREEIDTLAAMLTAQAYPEVAPVGKGAEVQELGETLALRGAWDRNIPECVACHGPGGRGVGEVFPPLAGQPAQYLAAQLIAWQQGTRTNDPNDLMGHIGRSLTADEIEAVSKYFAGLKK
ncbi:c-type cytochrome [Aromatoleum buckelii]|uniref:c-type cytochrome n=1 Tax=Aromatoleum buckelii TaxID=200254 RepID=UPI00248BE3FC|nr:c-type cytochrome [Aromatoleum buckelii]